MVQASIIGYLVGGAFLDLAYFDLPYNLLVVLLVTRAWLRRQGWISDKAAAKGRWQIPGVNAPSAEVAT